LQPVKIEVKNGFCPLEDAEVFRLDIPPPETAESPLIVQFVKMGPGPQSMFEIPPPIPGIRFDANVRGIAVFPVILQLAKTGIH
jgi:hypothetical protein